MPPTPRTGSFETGPYKKCVIVTPNDTQSPTAELFRAVMNGGAVAGTITLTSLAGVAVTFTAAPGVIYPIATDYIWATGTTATPIIGLA